MAELVQAPGQGDARRGEAPPVGIAEHPEPGEDCPAGEQ